MSDRDEHERYKYMLGAYVLGGLDPADRAGVDAHVATCTDCRRELAEFAVVPGLLARAPVQELEPSAAPDSPALQGALRSLSANRRSRRRLATAGIAGLAACALTAGVGIGTVIGASQGPDEAPAQRTVQLAGEAGVMGGSADLAAKPWGTELRLDLHDLPAKERLKVVVVGNGGRHESAATWSVPDAGRIRLTSAVSMSQESVKRIEVRNDHDEVLASSDS